MKMNELNLKDVGAYLRRRNLIVKQMGYDQILYELTSINKEITKLQEKIKLQSSDIDIYGPELRTVEVCKSKNTLHSKIDSNLLSGFLNFCVKSIKLNESLGEFRLMINGKIVSDKKSVNGVYSISDVAESLEVFKKPFSIHNMDSYLTQDQRSDSFNFSLVESMALVFDNDFKSDERYDVETEYYQVFVNGPPYIDKHPMYV